MNRHEPSPFLHREEQRPAVRYVPSAQRDRLAADRAQAKITLERLRYRWWVRQGTLGSFLQRLGDWGRKHFGWMDPRQTGGGWF